MKKGMKIAIVVVILAIIVAGAFWAKGYYNKRYVLADSYYTQIPLDEVNEDSVLLDDNGQEAADGKQYSLVGYNEAGEKRNVSFFARGKAEDYYAPGTYIKVDVSETLEIGESIVEESEVPEKALAQIEANGTKR